MLRKFFVAAALLLFAAPSQAGVVSSLLTFDGTPDTITDDSVGNFVERGTVDGILEVGDLLQGMISFGPLAGNAVPTGQSVIGAYSLRVKSIGVGGTSLVLEAASGADDVVTLLGAAGVDLSGLTGTHVGASNGFALLESTSVEIDRTSFVGPTFGFIPPTVGSDFEAVAILGFDGVDDHHNISSFGADLTDLSVAAGFAGTGVPFALFNGTYSITDHSFGGGTIFLPLTNVISGAEGDVTIVNGFISGTNSDTIGKGWDYNDDGDFVINAVPEPTSLAIFAVIGLGAARRRRRA